MLDAEAWLGTFAPSTLVATVEVAARAAAVLDAEAWLGTFARSTLGATLEVAARAAAVRDAEPCAAPGALVATEVETPRPAAVRFA